MTSTETRPRPALTLAGYYGFTIIGINGVLIPSLIRQVERDFHQNDAAFGVFYFLSALVYAVCSFGGGLLTERIGRKWVLAAASLTLGAGLGGEAAAASWPALLLAAALVNAGAGAIDSGINALFLDVHRQARGGALNLLHLFFSLGALIGPIAVGQAVGAGAPWRSILVVVAAACAALSAAFVAVHMPSGRHAKGDGEVKGGEVAGAEASLLPFAGLACGIGLYVAAELGVSNWVVKLLSNVPVATATAVLSVFWAGLALGRLLSRWIAERLDYYVFTVSCTALASVALATAVLVPIFPISVAFFGLAGFCYGPVYPMIMALGGNIYPHRLSALSGGLGASAIVGSLVYPPLMGLLAARIGLQAGMLGAALLGIPAVAVVLAARSAVRRAERRAAHGEQRSAPLRQAGR